MNYFKHPTAIVESKYIGKNTSVWQFSVILNGARIGGNCNINCHCFIENDVTVGNNVTLKSGVYLWDGVSIADDVFVGPNVTFTNDATPRSKRHPKKYEAATLMKGCSIGAASVLIGDIKVGPYAMVGAGSVVTKDVPAYNLWLGSPARFHAYVCQCGHKLPRNLKCESCGKKFKSVKGNIKPA